MNIVMDSIYSIFVDFVYYVLLTFSDFLKNKVGIVTMYSVY